MRPRRTPVVLLVLGVLLSLIALGTTACAAPRPPVPAGRPPAPAGRPVPPAKPPVHPVHVPTIVMVICG